MQSTMKQITIQNGCDRPILLFVQSKEWQQHTKFLNNFKYWPEIWIDA